MTANRTNERATRPRQEPNSGPQPVRSARGPSQHTHARRDAHPGRDYVGPVQEWQEGSPDSQSSARVQAFDSPTLSKSLGPNSARVGIGRERSGGDRVTRPGEENGLRRRCATSAGQFTEPESSKPVCAPKVKQREYRVKERGWDPGDKS